jgi:hypothetical protein
MAEWQRGKTVDLLTILMNDPEARKDPHLRAVIKRLRAEHRQMVRENAQTVAQLATLTTENYKTRNSVTRRRKTASGSNRRKTRNASQ